MAETNNKASRVDQLSRRIAYYRRVFAIGLGRKASAMEAAAILRAAKLTALAELAASDPEIGINDVVRADGCAARARRDMAAVLEAAKREPSHNIPLREQLAAEAEHGQ